jgi:hypothetical protein
MTHTPNARPSIAEAIDDTHRAFFGSSTSTTTGFSGRSRDIPPEDEGPFSSSSKTPDIAPWRGFYYNGRRYFRDVSAKFIPMDRGAVNRHLIQVGYSSNPKNQGEHGLVSDALTSMEVANYVDFVGPFAGADRGLLDFGGGRKMLVTESPRVPEPTPGDWHNLRAVIEGLLGDSDPDQLASFHGWVKSSFLSLQARKYRPAPALVLCGPKACGKSLLLSILQHVLGGRSADCFQWLSGSKEFNSACVGAELLVIDDKFGSSDPRARMAIAAGIKSSLFAGAVSIEAKNIDAFCCRPWWRLAFAVNDEAEAMMVIPAITEDVSDKISLLKCRPFPLPMPAGTDDEKEKFHCALCTEIPAYLHWILTGFELPARLWNERCGVAAYRHPDLESALRNLSPEEQVKSYLIDCIERNFLEVPGKHTAADIQRVLCSANCEDCHAARRLLHWHGACGQYLARLASQYPHWIEKAGKVHGVERWFIKSETP